MFDQDDDDDLYRDDGVTINRRRGSSNGRCKRSHGPPVDSDAVISVEIIVIFFVTIIFYVKQG